MSELEIPFVRDNANEIFVSITVNHILPRGDVRRILDRVVRTEIPACATVEERPLKGRVMRIKKVGLQPPWSSLTL